MSEVLNLIETIDADFGGTNILEPLLAATLIDVGNRNRRIFLLTDGEVDDKQQVIDLARS